MSTPQPDPPAGPPFGPIFKATWPMDEHEAAQLRASFALAARDGGALVVGPGVEIVWPQIVWLARAADKWDAAENRIIAVCTSPAAARGACERHMASEWVPGVRLHWTDPVTAGQQRAEIQLPPNERFGYWQTREANSYEVTAWQLTDEPAPAQLAEPEALDA